MKTDKVYLELGFFKFLCYNEIGDFYGFKKK